MSRKHWFQWALNDNDPVVKRRIERKAAKKKRKNQQKEWRRICWDKESSVEALKRT